MLKWKHGMKWNEIDYCQVPDRILPQILPNNVILQQPYLYKSKGNTLHNTLNTHNTHNTHNTQTTQATPQTQIHIVQVKKRKGKKINVSLYGPEKFFTHTLSLIRAFTVVPVHKTCARDTTTTKTQTIHRRIHTKVRLASLLCYAHRLTCTSTSAIQTADDACCLQSWPTHCLWCLLWWRTKRSSSHRCLWWLRWQQTWWQVEKQNLQNVVGFHVDVMLWWTDNKKYRCKWFISPQTWFVCDCNNMNELRSNNTSSTSVQIANWTITNRFTDYIKIYPINYNQI